MELLTGLAIVSTLVKLVIDRVRRQWPSLDGALVNILAVALGFAATYIPDVVEVADGITLGWVDRVAAGALIAGVSSFFADLTTSESSPTVILEEGRHER